MIIRKESKCRETGEIKVHYTTDSDKTKVVYRNGKPIEVEMSPEEMAHNDHGVLGNPDKKEEKEKEELLDIEQSEWEQMKSINNEGYDPFNKISLKIEKLKNQLKQAKLDQKEMQLVKREAEVVKKEKQTKNLDKVLQQDRKKLKDKHSYYTDDTPGQEKTKELETDVVNKIKDLVGEEESKEETFEYKESVMDKIERYTQLNETVYGKKTKKKGDILSLLEDKLNEAEDDEEEKDEGDEEEGGDEEGSMEDELGLGDEEEGGDEEGGDEEDGEGEQEEPEEEPIPNEVEQIVNREEFNLGSENTYDFYDFLINRIVSSNAKRALNVVYNDIPEDKRKIMPAQSIYDKIVKKLSALDKAESERLDTDEMGDEGGGGEDEGLEI
jgi:hypothetical protein